MATNIDYNELRHYAQLTQQRAQAAQEAEAEPGSNPAAQRKPMSRGFFAVFLVIAIIGDVVDFFTGGTIGWVIGMIIDAILLLGFGFKKGSRKQFQRILIGIGLETVLPIINMLPFRTLALIWAYMESRGKTKSVATAVNIVSNVTKTR